MTSSEHTLAATLRSAGQAVLLPDDSAIAEWEAFNLLCERLAERIAGAPDWRPEESELPSAPLGAYRLMAGALAVAAVDAFLADDPFWRS